MTLRELLLLMTRRWYVLVAAALMAGLLTILLVRDGGTFYTKTIVTFTFPEASVIRPDNGSEDESVIAFAGTVATQINLGKPPPRYSRDDAPFYGAGVRQGVLVGLRDGGTQWGSMYSTAILQIEIVGRTFDWVEETQQAVLSDVAAITESRQRASRVAPADRIAVHVEPLTKKIEYIAPTRVHQIMAIAAIAGAAVMVGGWGAVAVDRATHRRRIRGQRAADTSSPVEGITA